MWNISVVVCNLAGLDKNWTDFKKKARTASKARATGMILRYDRAPGYDTCLQRIQCLQLMLWQYQTEQKAQNFLAIEVRLCMGIADKIEVLTIAIDEKTILEITATIALPYSDQRLSVLFAHSFCFACKTCSFFYFLSAAVFRFVFLSAVVALQRKTILDLRKFR